MPVLTAIQGDNSDLLAQVAELYLSPDQRILDMTYGLGVFWRSLPDLCIVKNDIDAERGDIHYDFRDMPHEDECFDVVVLDPPYAGRSGSPITGAIDRGYNIAERAHKHGIHGHDAVMALYFEGIEEAHRLLVTGGLLLVKCMDEIMGGRQRRSSIEIWERAMQLNFLDEDLFVLMQKGVPTMRHSYQIHARKNHSYLWIFRKRKQ